MKSIVPLSVASLLGLAGVADATLTTTETTNPNFATTDSGWSHLSTTLGQLNTKQGHDAPSLDLTLVIQDKVHKVSLKPQELLEVMKVIEAASNGAWDEVDTMAGSTTVKHLLPALSVSVFAQGVAQRTDEVTVTNWNDALTKRAAFISLADALDEQVQKGLSDATLYLPSPLVAGDDAFAEGMKKVEDALFEKWNTSDVVTGDLVAAETAAELLRAFGRYPRGNREIFDYFLAGYAKQNKNRIWELFGTAARTATREQSEHARFELLRASYLALEKARQNQAKPSNLFVEVVSSKDDKSSRVTVNEPVRLHFSYDIGPGVDHTIWLSLRDKEGTIVYEKTLDKVKLSSNHRDDTVTLPGLEFPGNYQASLTIRNAHGHFSDISDSFRVLTPMPKEEADQLSALTELFDNANSEAQNLVQRLTTLTERFDELEPELLSNANQLDTVEEELAVDTLENSAEENVEKWLSSGRYHEYVREVEAFNEDVNVSDDLLAESQDLASRLAQLEELTAPLAEALDSDDLDRALEVVRASPLAEELGYVNPNNANAATTVTTTASETTTTPAAETAAVSSVEATPATTEPALETSTETADTRTEAEETVVEDTTAATNVETVNTTVATTVDTTNAAETTVAATTEGTTNTALNTLEEAILADDIEAATTALENGADINARSGTNNEHILHRYIRSAEPTLATVKFLVNNGANIHAVDAEGNGLTAMMSLALSSTNSSEREAILRYFIDEGVHFNALALKRIKGKTELLTQKREEAGKLTTDTNKPYLFEEAVSLLEEAEEGEVR